MALSPTYHSPGPVEGSLIQLAEPLLLARGESSPEPNRAVKSAASGSLSRDGYPMSPGDYDLSDELGHGATAIVYLARCTARNEMVAVKLINLEKIAAAGGLEVILREVATMRELRHPNLLPLLAAFVHQHHLWMVTPYYRGGSLRSILEYEHIEGFKDWQAVATCMREVLKALEYMHQRGRMHRDVKARPAAANILVDGNGHVVLADFGICAALEVNTSEQKPPEMKRPSLPHSFKWRNSSHAKDEKVSEAAAAKKPVSAPLRDVRPFRNAEETAKYLGRKSFVGTVYFQAPEVMAPQSTGYGCSADIWSFGITLVELATGSAPNSRCSQNTILLRVVHSVDAGSIVKNIPHSPESFKELVYACLTKDASDRPTATQLLQFRFFKNLAFDARYLAHNMLRNLPPPAHRDKRISERLSSGPGSRIPLLKANSVSSFGSPASLTFNTANANRQGSNSLSPKMSGLESSRGSMDLQDDAADLRLAVDLLRQLGRGGLEGKDLMHAFDVDNLRSCKGLGFAVVKRSGTTKNCSGHGFVIARLETEEEGGVAWSAPSFFTETLKTTGFTCGNDSVGMLFPIEGDIDGFKSGSHCIMITTSQPKILRSCQSYTSHNFCELSISRGSIKVNEKLHSVLYNTAPCPADILGGLVKPPRKFAALYSEITSVLCGVPLAEDKALPVSPPVPRIKLQPAPVIGQTTPFASQPLQMKKEDSMEENHLSMLRSVMWDFESDGSYETPASLLSNGSQDTQTYAACLGQFASATNISV